MSAEPASAEGHDERLREMVRLVGELDEHAPTELAKLLESSALEDSARQVLQAFVALQPMIHDLHVVADLIQWPAPTELHGSAALALAALAGLAPPRLTPTGAARKVSVSIPEDLTAAVQQRVGHGKFSHYVTEAVTRQLELDLLADLSDLLTAGHGPVPEELLAEARAAWPDA
jgi:hypothetical protein